MGNCGSSLDCNLHHTEIEVNPDIAGIGVLISFYFGAIALSIVVIWAYFTGCLPPDVLTPTDHYAVQILHQSFKTRSRVSGRIDLDFKPTPKQRRRSEVVVGFVKVLGDQQLITGVAILIAGLASRCQISIYEFNIVFYLAYFAEFTHYLSLGVLRRYLYHHEFVRNCRVIFTIGFLVVFGFSFIINSVGVMNLEVGSKLQCIFDAPKLGKYLHFNALVDLYYLPETTSTAELVHTCCIAYLRKKKGVSKVDAQLILIKARSKYVAWFHPPLSSSGKTRISVWFLLEEYYQTYCSVIPMIFQGVAYGTGSTVLAIWSDEVELVNGLEILGFGQIVAIGLLGLTILAAVEIVNEQRFLETRTRNRESALDQEISEVRHGNSLDINEEIRALDKANVTPNSDRTDSLFLRRLVCLWARKSNDDLATVRSGKISTPKLDEVNARKIGQFAIRYGLVESCICIFLGLGLNFEVTTLPALTIFLMYATCRLLLDMKCTLSLVYFIHDELRLLQNQQRSESQLGLVRPISDQSTTTLPSSNASLHSNSPSVTRANSQEMELQSIVEEEQTVSSGLNRQDTEADIGLVPPTRRNTFRSADVDENSHGCNS